ncbi:MAG: penicillin acylase family protein [Halanaerobiales bacterium]|nr:penicillin acylase family protein [Halanaerobiales bacterium]
MKKWVLIAIVLLAFGTLTCQGAGVVIHRDLYGVPHIYSGTMEGLYYGFGYSVAQDRLFQIEMLKRMYFGRAAEVYGEDFYSLDLYWRNEFPNSEELLSQFQMLDVKYQKIIKSYADGINAWIDEVLENPEEKMSFEFHNLGIQPEYWREVDVAAAYLASLGFFMDLANEIPNANLFTYLLENFGDRALDYFDDLIVGADPGAFTTIFSGNLAGTVVTDKEDQYAKLDAIGLKKSAEVFDANNNMNSTLVKKMGYELSQKMSNGSSRAASYCLVVGSEKLETGNPFLMGGPQFDFWLPSIVHEVGLHGAGFNVVGSTLVGSPFIMFGQTKNTAFTSTAGASNMQDIYEEKLNPENPTEYLFNGEWLDMETRIEEFWISGEKEPREKILYRTVHGPVITQVDIDGDGINDVAYSKKLSCYDTYLSGIVSWTEVMQARTPDEFLDATQLLTMNINHFYADNRGNIGYYLAGKYPIRNYDPRFPAQGTGENEWMGFLSTEEHPHVINPESGIILNWNNKPELNWINGDLSGILGWACWSEDHRSEHLADVVFEKESLNREDIADIIHNIADSDFRSKSFKSYLLQAIEPLSAEKWWNAANLLRSWDDLRSDNDKDGYYDSTGITLFNSWWNIVNERIFADELGEYWTLLLDNYAGYSLFLRVILGEDASVPLKNDYLNGQEWRTVFVESLGEAMDALTEQYGTSDMTQWKTEIKMMSFLPIHMVGVPTSQGMVEEIKYMDRGSQNHIVELTFPIPTGKNVCPPGQSGFISKDGVQALHFKDQLDLFTTWQFKDMLFKKGDVLVNSTSTEILIYRP